MRSLKSKWKILFCCRLGSVLAVGMLILLAGCTRSASQSPAVFATESVASVIVESAQVTQGAGIYITGRSTIPDGACVTTRLHINQKPAEWWPADRCIEVDAGRWEMLVALGRSGAPEKLEPGTDYEIQAWWPEMYEETITHFSFDLDGPKQP